MQELLETAELEAFARIVESGSLSKAAMELEVPRATIGRRLARLEERLGVRLVRRSTRRLALTDAGTTLYHHALAALTAVREAAASVRGVEGSMRGRLRISVPPLANESFHALVNDFLGRFPEVQLHVHASTQHVDLLEGGFDLALRAGGALDPGLVARPLARSRSLAVASPGYLARRGTPKRARDLREHACLLGFDRGIVPSHYWPLRNGSTLRVDGPFASNEPTGLQAAAVAGHGIALLPLFFAAPALATGQLVAVLPERVGGQVQIAVVYAERELVPQIVRVFVDELVAWGRKEFVALAEIEAKCPKHAAGRRKPTKRRHGP
ncbi:MAG: LysR family transcriptional regulator [Deltaproteobacteria bacterium]|nr:LysR family transcriptional regulator [Nannocystaceae bacterium]